VINATVIARDPVVTVTLLPFADDEAEDAGLLAEGEQSVAGLAAKA
jgi:hypothetical protein